MILATGGPHKVFRRNNLLFVTRMGIRLNTSHKNSKTGKKHEAQGQQISMKAK
jgi:hypothetical protein